MSEQSEHCCVQYYYLYTVHCTTKCTIEEEKYDSQVRRNIKNEIKNVEVWTASQGSTFASLRHDWTKI